MQRVLCNCICLHETGKRPNIILTIHLVHPIIHIFIVTPCSFHGNGTIPLSGSVREQHEVTHLYLHLSICLVEIRIWECCIGLWQEKAPHVPSWFWVLGNAQCLPEFSPRASKPCRTGPYSSLSKQKLSTESMNNHMICYEIISTRDLFEVCITLISLVDTSGCELTYAAVKADALTESYYQQQNV